MGGEADDTLSSHACPSEGELSVDQDFPQFSSQFPTFTRAADDGLLDGNLDEAKRSFSPPLDLQARLTRNNGVYREILRQYDDNLSIRSEGLAQAKSKILSYHPGCWVEEVGGLKSSDYQVPPTTCLMLIGPRGSGKSSLINKISRAFEDDKFAPERAQVSFNATAGDGTYFLQEYMIPRGSTSFCLYDTRSLSPIHAENTEKIKLWMTKGIRHGELVTRESDGPVLRKRLKSKARWNCHRSSVFRMVNFVLFVVDGLSVLKSIEGSGDEESWYTELIARTYDVPYLSFNDDKPVVVVTHGDLLSVSERARVRVHLGELLGIPPGKQIFDIPDGSDPTTELTVVDMLRYSLEHADRNLPRKTWLANQFPSVSTLRISHPRLLSLAVALVVIAIAVGLAQSVSHRRRSRSQLHKVHIDWSSIRHMWLG